eukprot:TRINITY_DN3198_c0_g1_i1.p1 TRINITY_DN3198_c0_g1~~TRINITY_DN3198_c0_g1_i1.p1  ORF type:complete len:586 (-),score=89.78 TRINITY_DN3198_c0_g1_i1:116-1873(-)
MSERKTIAQKVSELIERKEHFFSIEFFPPKTPLGVKNLYATMDKFSSIEPLFIDVTWGAGGSTSILTTSLCINSQKYFGLETNMHLTCTNMPIDTLNEALRRCKEVGLKNVLTLRGDPPQGQKEWHQITGGFAHASDLVKYVRKNYGHYFGVGVAGYPEKHMDAPSYEEDLRHLKAKVDAGADMIITQLFFDANLFLNFEKDCRKIGIKVPILPGVMPITSAGLIRRICDLCKTNIPTEIIDAIEPIKDDNDKVIEYGIKQCTEMCKKLMENGVYGIHFYTLNTESSSVAVLKNLGFLENIQLRRQLPWRRPVLDSRMEESVRPVHWLYRPKSYIARTEDWTKYPNGTWKNYSSKFGEMLLDHVKSLHPLTKKSKKRAWGSPKSIGDVNNMFVSFAEGKIRFIPFRDTYRTESVQHEDKKYVDIVKQGYLVINNLPRLNALPSEDKAQGWGGKGGHIYQKAYIEFFCSPENWSRLTTALKAFPTIKYQGSKASGPSEGNITSTIGITWGVWPDREIIQPNIVNPKVFDLWKEEAFLLWEDWYSVFTEESEEKRILKDVANTYYLGYVVDTDYEKGDIFALFKSIK